MSTPATLIEAMHSFFSIATPRTACMQHAPGLRLGRNEESPPRSCEQRFRYTAFSHRRNGQRKGKSAPFGPAAVYYWHSPHSRSNRNSRRFARPANGGHRDRLRPLRS